MTNIEQIIIEKVHQFPPEKQQKLLEYAESLDKIEHEAKHETLWEMVKDLVEEVPKEAWDELPTDSSINVDHYLYGHQKKTK